MGVSPPCSSGFPSLFHGCGITFGPIRMPTPSCTSVPTKRDRIVSVICSFLTSPATSAWPMSNVCSHPSHWQRETDKQHEADACAGRMKMINPLTITLWKAVFTPLIMYHVNFAWFLFLNHTVVYWHAKYFTDIHVHYINIAVFIKQICSFINNISINWQNLLHQPILLGISSHLFLY